MGFSILLLFAILMYLKYRRYRPRATGAIGKPQHILKLAKLEDSERPSFEHQEISYGHSKYKSHALLSVGIDCAPLFHQSGSPNSGSPDSAVRKWAIDAFPSRRRDSRPKSLSTIITGREYNSRYIHRRERSFTEPAMERSGALPSLLISPDACPRAYTPSMSAASPGTTSCATTPTHTDVISQLEQLQREVDMLRREQRNLAQGLRDDPPPSYVEGASSRTKDDR
ncbi:hypothetical protein GLOTRDRAFT_111989 [Gloeophyllum trabeum ATCC 11539]|uniref:Uncharacterized protein n=1 Tax=Gloeophyllum trabeum (strain ATCC 11539 / FP-39264 / Madison 617) TaxID=670483 RepID=S7PYJ2_GLOTA|nr:uncharacterized protein GLOTRDRAFT_111989 [Gloeophyllum trabeum ATCC 11539]EPQ52518.1 hypothetical protein GLOTRDRAFT_111989 [Gloeophyllum trabeum ATCC 11539]